MCFKCALNVLMTCLTSLLIHVIFTQTTLVSDFHEVKMDNGFGHAYSNLSSFYFHESAFHHVICYLYPNVELYRFNIHKLKISFTEIINKVSVVRKNTVDSSGQENVITAVSYIVTRKRFYKTT
jgi:hypothetical protein